MHTKLILGGIEKGKQTYIPFKAKSPHNGISMEFFFFFCETYEVKFDLIFSRHA